jgi:peptidyl-prolyl cis-trans isomerase C
MRNFIVGAMALGVAAWAGAGAAVLRINGVDIDQAQVDLAKHGVEQLMGGRKADSATILRHALDQLIGRTLLVQAARKAKMEEDPAEVDAALARMAAKAGGEEAFAKQLAADGIDRQELRRTEGEQLLVKRYVQTVMAQEIQVTPADGLKYYNEHPKEFAHPEQWQLRMILVEVPQGADEKTVSAAKKKAEAALARVKKGEDFATVAKEVSTDPTAPQGGEVGWVRKGLLLPELEQVLDLKPGEVSGVLRSKYGFHIFKVEATRPAGTYGYEEVGHRLLEFLKERRLREAVSAKAVELRKSATIEPLTPEIKQALAPPDAATKP